MRAAMLPPPAPAMRPRLRTSSRPRRRAPRRSPRPQGASGSRSRCVGAAAGFGQSVTVAAGGHARPDSLSPAVGTPQLDSSPITVPRDLCITFAGVGRGGGVWHLSGQLPVRAGHGRGDAEHGRGGRRAGQQHPGCALRLGLGGAGLCTCMCACWARKHVSHAPRCTQPPGSLPPHPACASSLPLPPAAANESFGRELERGGDNWSRFSQDISASMDPGEVAAAGEATAEAAGQLRSQGAPPARGLCEYLSVLQKNNACSV